MFVSASRQEKMDEFSDFQMAVQKPPPSVIGVGLTAFVNNVAPGKLGGGNIFSDSSPVHSLATQSKSDIVRSQLSKPVVPPANNIGTNVGSRLANYDLGLSGPCPNNIQGGMELSKTIINPRVRSNNPDLLIGEEDKYSALRMLIENDFTPTITSTTTNTSIFEKPLETNYSKPATVSQTNNLISTPAPLSMPNLANDSGLSSNFTSALEFSNNIASTGDTSDFGDFQSFNGFQTNNHVNLPSIADTTVGDSRVDNLDSVTKKTDVYGIVENGTSDTDAEFGDFISVEPSISIPPVTLAPSNSWNASIDLSKLTITPPPPPQLFPQLPPLVEEKKPDFLEDNVMSFDYLGKTVENQSYPHQLDLEQGAGSNLIFSDFVSSTSTSSNHVDQGPVLDCLEKDTFGIDIKPPQSLPVFPVSNFIRTSLIRNDEVTDIDAVKWNQSEDTNNECPLEYSNFDKKDFACKSKFLDVSPETRSIASLDLGSYVSVDYTETNSKSSFFDLQTPTSVKSTTLVTPAPLHLSNNEPIMYNDFDKYQCFRDECENEKERYFTEWNRCLQACKSLISKAFSVFNGASTSEVIKEIVSDESGYSYVMNIREIYRIAQRIQTSSEKLGVDTKLGDVFVEINNFWETITAFLLGTCVSVEVCEEISIFDDGVSNDSYPSCGVCLCGVDVSITSQYVDYGGKIYHCKCANFWVNEIDAILPSLSYVSNSNHMSKFDKNSLV